MNDPVRRVLGELWLQTDRRFLLLERSQEIDRRHYDRIVDARLTAVVQHAYRNAPEWRRRLTAAGIDDTPTDIRGALRRLPPLERSELQQSSPRWLSEDLETRRWYRNSSGGSTGEPVTLIQDMTYLRWARATKALFDAWSGYRTGMPKMVVWGSPRDSGEISLRQRTLRWLKNERWFDAYRIDDAAIAAWTAQLERTRPAQLLGYAESLDLWARILREQGRQVAGPTAVMTTAGVCTPDMRERIAAGFNAPVFDRYGCREVGDIAAQTRHHDGLVIPPWHVYVELLDADGRAVGPGEEGDVVVTSLTNYAMPLLRYRLGDRACWARDSAVIQEAVRPTGTHVWPALERLVGRTTDHLLAADGRFVHAGAIRTALYGLDGLRLYQVEQNELDHVLVRVVPSPHTRSDRVSTSVQTRLRTLLHDLLGPATKLTVQIVDDIAPTATGKHRHVICSVQR